MSSYVTKQEYNQLKTKFNSFVQAVAKQFNANKETLEKHKTSINGILNGVKQIQTSLKNVAAQASDTSSADETIAKLNSVITQLNATVDYMENWADTGNLTMKDVRDSVGEALTTMGE